MRRSVIISSVFLLAAGLIQFACVQDFDQFDPGAATGGTAGSGGETSSSSGTAGAGGAASSSSSSSSSTSSSASSSSTASSASSSSGGIPCMNGGDCPQDTPCENWSCTMGKCGSTFDPPKSPAGDPKDGDCMANFCDGNGNVIPGNDDNDTPPGDGNPCTTASCNNGTPMTTNDPVGSDCNNGDHCNDMAMCVECIGDGDCNAGTNPSCFQDNCISCSDGMKNGDEADVDCGGTKCTKRCAGATCTDGMECLSNFCADGVCCDTSCTGTCKSCGIDASKGTCTNIPLGMTDDAPACDTNDVCNGNGLCKLKNGEDCNNDGECASNNCAGNPKKCAP